MAFRLGKRLSKREFLHQNLLPLSCRTSACSVEGGMPSARANKCKTDPGQAKAPPDLQLPGSSRTFYVFKFKNHSPRAVPDSSSCSQ